MRVADLAPRLEDESARAVGDEGQRARGGEERCRERNAGSETISRHRRHTELSRYASLVGRRCRMPETTASSRCGATVEGASSPPTLDAIAFAADIPRAIKLMSIESCVVDGLDVCRVFMHGWRGDYVSLGDQTNVHILSFSALYHEI